MKLYITCICVFVLVFGYGQDCSIDYSSFNSYRQLQDHIESKYDCKSPWFLSSDWIDKLSYCAYGAVQSYLIMKTKRKSYIHEPISKELWDALINSDSVGSFYARRIKGKYRVEEYELGSK